MDLTRDPSDIARSLADEARTLNHRTNNVTAFYGQDDDGQPFINSAPGNVAATVEQLIILAGRLPQALEQSARALQHCEEQQAIRMADGSDVGEQVSRALRGMLDAQQAIQVAFSHLREAGGPLAAMGGHFVDDGKLEDVDASK